MSKTVYGLVYGANGADYPEVAESGPYATEADALADVDKSLSRKLGGVVLVGDYRASDGESITTGTGRVLRVIA